MSDPVFVEASQNGPTFNELMWAHITPDDDRVDSYIINRSDQPGGTYAAIGRAPNYPHRMSSAQLGQIGISGSQLGKCYFRDMKPDAEDLTWYYKVQRVDWKGIVHPDDITLSDLIPRTIPSFEETHGGYPVNLFSLPTQEYVDSFVVATGTTFAAGDAVFDIIRRFGQPASTIEMTATAAHATFLFAANNRNNNRIALPASAVDRPYRLGPGNVWTYRLLFENGSGGPITVALKMIVGVQP